MSVPITAKKKILIIEDDPFIVKMYRNKFEDLGYIFRDAGDGEKGIAMAKEERPDIMVLDIVLPHMDGFEILKAIKKDKDLKDIPVMMLTNLGQRDEVEKGLSLGADDYLIKTHFTPSEVVEKVTAILKNKAKK